MKSYRAKNKANMLAFHARFIEIDLISPKSAGKYGGMIESVCAMMILDLIVE